MNFARLFFVLRQRFLKRKLPKLMLFAYLEPDIENLEAIGQVLKSSQIPYVVLISRFLLKKNPGLKQSLRGRGVRYHSFPLFSAKIFDFFIAHFDGLLTLVESSAGPHQLGQSLTLRAQKIGLKTYTFQHGLENIGLTYFDQVYTPTSVQFSSGAIFTWCELTGLSDKITSETRQLCHPTGNIRASLKPISGPYLQRLVAENRPIVSVFENLHWERYSPEYRRLFLEQLDFVSKEFPAVRFVVKTHPAGKWLEHSNRQSLLKSANVVILTNGHPEAHFSGLELISVSKAVITSPSTIALDCANLKVPVAVATLGSSFEFYLPLAQLNTREDWCRFVSANLESASPLDLQKLEFFLGRKSIPKGIGTGLIDKIKSDFLYAAILGL